MRQPGKLRIGTSGYSYADWKGPFYPSDLPQRDFLPYYATHFDACEINFSYYRMPTAKTLASMVERTDGRVQFAIKATRTLTHEPAADLATEAATFRTALAPFVDARVLGGVLLGFPGGLRPSPGSWDRIRRLLDALAPLPRVVEFRHRSWLSEATFDRLRDQGAAFCCVDEPALPSLIPPVAVVTAEPAYVRFHGRNRDKWFGHEAAHERYNYDYSDDELAEWVPRIERLAKRSTQTLVFFNNHFQARAVSAANRLREMLLGAPAR